LMLTSENPISLLTNFATCCYSVPPSNVDIKVDNNNNGNVENNCNDDLNNYGINVYSNNNNGNFKNSGDDYYFGIDVNTNTTTTNNKCYKVTFTIANIGYVRPSMTTTTTMTSLTTMMRPTATIKTTSTIKP